MKFILEHQGYGEFIKVLREFSDYTRTPDSVQNDKLFAKAMGLDKKEGTKKDNYFYFSLKHRQLSQNLKDKVQQSLIFSMF